METAFWSVTATYMSAMGQKQTCGAQLEMSIGARSLAPGVHEVAPKQQRLNIVHATQKWIAPNGWSDKIGMRQEILGLKG